MCSSHLRKISIYETCTLQTGINKHETTYPFMAEARLRKHGPALAATEGLSGEILGVPNPPTPSACFAIPIKPKTIMLLLRCSSIRKWFRFQYKMLNLSSKTKYIECILQLFLSILLSMFLSTAISASGLP